MRRIAALIVLWAGLLGGSPVLACGTGAAGDCCPPDAPAGCGQTNEPIELAATTCCLTSSAPSPAVSAERGREQQFLKDDCGSADPVGIATALVSLPHEERQSSGFDPAINRAAAPDRSLTYLHTGRLRL
jgi:hypothetical protein